MADVFLRAVATVDTFVTDGRLDRVVPIQGLPPALAARLRAVFEVVHDERPRPGFERPGWIQLRYAPGWAPDGIRERELRAPRYDTAGHTVTLDVPGLLLDDLVQWLEG